MDLTVPRGAIYGLIGPNAAGKTTTIDLIMGMGAKDAGNIEVFGLDHAKEEVAVKRQIGYVSPDLVFNAWGKVGRVVNFYRNFYPDWDDDYCTQLVKRLKLGWNDRVSTLSFGSRMKLNLLLALSHRPALLLLDEPMSGLDAPSRQEVYTELLDAVQEENRTVLISSHDLHDLERFTDHLGIINNGKLLLEGNTNELVERFKMVDCTTATGNKLPKMKGTYLQSRKESRLRLLVDMQAEALPKLEEQGMIDIVCSPVTLEELFVGLVKDQPE
jgi:ABC-2 type transport system ATP-binding protein